MLLLLACTETKNTNPDTLFEIAPVDLGERFADGSGLDLGDSDAVGMVLGAALPIFHEDPAWDTPWDVWKLTESNLVRDDGQCPTTEVLEQGSLWRGGCRSTDGYEFDGTLSEETWEEGGIKWHKLVADVEVEGDIDDPLFERLSIEGTSLQGERDDGLLHLDINLRIQVEGYWESRSPNDPRLTQWQDWRVSGTFETTEEMAIFSTAVALGSSGVATESTDLVIDAGCPIELKGTVALASDTSATATLGGVQSCDACADINGSLACNPG